MLRRTSNIIVRACIQVMITLNAETYDTMIMTTVEELITFNNMDDIV